ncbi:ZIP Zinc transporter [Diplocarpon rosae]|nr:ZIP Zinc transporter [Diplocarpon rosae]
MASEMDNDTRGWIMCIVSGIACVLGASIICVDVLIRCVSSKRNFRIQDSGAFLASSLSLSFGVMIFSALYSILPSSKKYLIQSGYKPSHAAWILLAGFVGGFIGIQVLSRCLHHYIPSHVVDCDHTHQETPHEGHSHSRGRSRAGTNRSQLAPHQDKANGEASESTPLLQSGLSSGARSPHHLGEPETDSMYPQIRRQSPFPDRRQSMLEVQKRVMSFVKDTKTNCNSEGPCFGYSDPCGQECFKHLTRSPTTKRSTTLLRSNTENFYPNRPGGSERHASMPGTRTQSVTHVTRARSCDPLNEPSLMVEDGSSDVEPEEDLEAQHHHHVPENAFMSIGLQTSIAIALHKLPEGFITYATNHANPSLGFSVFMALFVHNITEGFALALPLFLALKSRAWAMSWAALLGGLSQPMGAGIAAAWFKIAGHEGHKPGIAAYGVMFAITSGIMTNVALQLFVESLSMNHNRNLCIAFGFVGMAIMGTSNALTS